MDHNLNQLSWQNTTDQQKIITLIKNGKVIAGASDTVLGLLANTTAVGHAALNNIKGRAEKSYIVLIADKSKLVHFIPGPLLAPVQKLIEHCWPGPLTLILKAHVALPAYLKSHDGTIALRVPNHAGLLGVLQHFDGLFSTSANKSGMPVAERVEDLDLLIAKEVACIVVDETTKTHVSTPSTIIDCSSENLRVIREGAYSIKELELISDVNHMN